MFTGKPGPGRPKGCRNKRTLQLAEIVSRMKTTPAQVLAMIADGNLECGACHGKGKTKYQPHHGEDKLLERVCQSCYGSGRERITTKERSDAASELLQYQIPKLKAIEHRGMDGEPIQHRVRVIYESVPFKAEKPGSASAND